VSWVSVWSFDMVTFVSLFLSLISGIHPVKVAVDGPVARVDVVLDGERVGRLTGPPWTVRCDFGPEVQPHELVAVAFDSSGDEMDRASQFVNLPRARAETRVVFESDERGLPIAVRVFWESAEPIEPLAVFAIFDGQVLQPEEDGRYRLPPYDLDQIHIVTAEAQFVGGLTARTDVTFGGRYGSQVATELTAVPIQVDDRPPGLKDLDGAFRLRGGLLDVAAVERPGVKIFLVRDHAAVADMAAIKRRQDAFEPRRSVSDISLEDETLTPDHDQLHLVVANPIRVRHRELFPTSLGIDIRRWDVHWLVTHLLNQDASIRGQKLADAVAVAGVQAAAEGSPRAVLLVLSEKPRDRSRYDPDQVMGYLRSLRVPLYVWSVGNGATTDWGPAVRVDGPKSLRRATRSMLRELGRQWIVWVEGNHMVNQVELTGRARGFRLAGSELDPTNPG
jgi:hypothetical protein